MNRKLGELLVKEVAPRIQALAHSLNPVACDDRGELVADGIATAAKLLASTQARGKQVTPGNIAFFAVSLVRSGRRSTGLRKHDVLHPACRLTGRSRVMSMEESVGSEPDEENGMTLHDVLSARVEDPAVEAGRRIDWQVLLQSLDAVSKEILHCLAEGVPLTELSTRLKRSRSSIQDKKGRLAQMVQQHFGADILVQVAQQPRWRDSIEAAREKVACRYERQAV